MYMFCSHLYRKACLDVASGLTTKEREAFLFYCHDVLPASIADVCDRKDCDILGAFEALRRQRRFSYQDTDLLKDFLLIKGRRDLLKVVEEFDVSRDLIWLLEGLITSRSGTSLCHGEFSSDDTHRDERKGTAIIVDYMRNLVVESNELSVDTRALIKKAKSERVSTEGILADLKSELISETSDSQQSIWCVITFLIKVAVELAVMLHGADKTPTLRWEEEVKSICNFLIEEVVPRIIENGGWGEFQAYIGQEDGQDQRSENYKLCVRKIVSLYFLT